jgi:streptogramin lyase
MKKLALISAAFLLSITISCQNNSTSEHDIPEEVELSYVDESFVQEYHEGYLISESQDENDVRSIAIDQADNVWIATANGIFKKEAHSRSWNPVIVGEQKGPSYDVVVDDIGTVWMGTWDGVYKYRNNRLTKISGVSPPISALCTAQEGVYALGPQGSWIEKSDAFEAVDYAIASSVRDAISDGTDGLWVATDVGLYHCRNGHSTLFQDENEMISCYLKGLSYDAQGTLWLGGLGGITVRNDSAKIKTLTPEDGIPSAHVNSVSKSPDGTMWVGTDVGVVRYYKDGSNSLRFSKRWLLDDQVRDVAFDKHGNAWVATAKGVSAIRKKEMTLSGKEQYFYDFLMRRHIRDPWIAHVTKLTVAGDTATSVDIDDDNDGQYTAMYLAMEAMRYATTGEMDAKVKARKALDFLIQLQTITETDGFFARTIVPSDWTHVHDGNRKYNDKQLAEALVNEVRFKPVEKRWHKSKDGEWIWKGDTSSDEMCGHMAAYYFYYEHVADDEEKKLLRIHVKKIMDHVIAHDYTLIDLDGKHTYWGVWSPDKLNRDPDWAPERGINSLELLSYLKLVYHMTKDEKYQKLYLNMISEEGYLENARRIISSNQAWNTYIDPELLFLTFPPLFKYENDQQLKQTYNEIIDAWYQKFRKDESPFFNFMYAYLRDKNYDIDKSIFFLKDTPLDLVDWNIDHSKREDVIPTRYPVLEVLQTNVLMPPSERATVRWDKNPWELSGGNPHIEREPVFWLLPYWMGKYIGAIK